MTPAGLLQALAALFGAALTAAACYSGGALLIDNLGLKLRRSERLPLSFTLGAASLHLAIFTLLALHLAFRPVLIALVAAAVAIAIWKGSWRYREDPAPPLGRNLQFLFIALFAAFTTLYLFNAWAPEASPDGSGYHLGFVARYLRAHEFEHSSSMFAALSAGVDLLYLPAFAIGRHSAGALMHLAFSIALALSIFAYGRRLGKPWVGAAAALFTYASPVVGVAGSSAYNDVAVAAIVFSAFYWLEIWDESRDNRTLVAAGLLAGYACAAKYTAFVMVPFALAFVVWRSRKLRPLIPIAAFASLMVAPWLLKSWIEFQNPLAPFGNQLFRNPNFHIISMTQLQDYFRRYELPHLGVLPLEVTVRGLKTNGVIGPLFLAAPVALLALRYRAGRRLLAAGAVVLSAYFFNIGTRFLIPVLPFFSLALALALSASPALLAILMIFHALTCWPDILKRYADPSGWRLDRIPYREALRIVPQDRYLRQVSPAYGTARLVEENVPKGERVLAMNRIAESYTSREILVSFESAPNEVMADIVNVGWTEAYQPRRLQSFSLPEKLLRRIRIVQTAQANPLEQWSVHELRFFHHGVELPRTPDWRLRAWPNPGDVQMAFDNSPATRWRTWERAAPGMYLEVDFGKAQVLDEVRIETSYDCLNIRVILEAMNDAGTWVRIAENPVVTPVEPPANIRRAATRELQTRGVRYLLMHNEDFGAEDIHDDPEGWGLMQVAEGYGVRLYRVTR